MTDLMQIQIPLWAVLSYMVFMCAVQAMPRPSSASQPYYVWLFSFFHLLCMNLALFMDPMKKMVGQHTETYSITETTTDSSINTGTGDGTEESKPSPSPDNT